MMNLTHTVAGLILTLATTTYAVAQSKTDENTLIDVDQKSVTKKVVPAEKMFSHEKLKALIAETYLKDNMPSASIHEAMQLSQLDVTYTNDTRHGYDMFKNMVEQPSDESWPLFSVKISNNTTQLKLGTDY